MSWISDFDRLKLTSKVILLYFVFVIPFFFISIYLFKPEMIEIIKGNPFVNLHFFFLISFCFALSISWFGLVFIVSELTFSFAKKVDLQKKDGIKEGLEFNIEDTFVLTFIYSICYIMLGIAINHYLLNWSFKLFLLGCVGFIFFRFIWIGFFYLIFKKII
jgi:hypothetical protein